MDLFEDQTDDRIDIKNIPLAERIRPRSLSEVVGQNEITGPESWLSAALSQQQLSPMIMWGPPGVGKTSIARAIAEEFNAEFISVSAVNASVKDIRAILEKAKRDLRKNRRTVLFIDEIHRFNKGQQDALLHAVEDGTVILMGATTENPSFEVNAPLLSRCHVLTLKPLSAGAQNKLLEKALNEDPVLSGYQIEIIDRDYLFHLSGGDGRQLLNILERALPLARKGDRYIVTPDILQQVALKQVPYDKKGENHYDTISAFIKSVRGSDPDGALFWLARMLVAGEDPLFIARRLVILASEDIGNAEPYALSLATAAFQAVSVIGMPEARIILSQVTTYLASVPKSNAAYKAIDEAMKLAGKTRKVTVPLHLRNAPTKLMKNLDYGKEYRYPHSFKFHYVKQQYLPDEVGEKIFYHPTQQGREKKLAEYLSFIKKIKEND
jgi:putative ATPase